MLYVVAPQRPVLSQEQPCYWYVIQRIKLRWMPPALLPIEMIFKQMIFV